MDRIIFLGTGIDDYVANIITAQLLFLESMDAKRDIQIYINSPGGSVYAGLGIYDTMQYINPDVSTICIGMAASMGAVLLCAGQDGKRTGLKHARVMIHQPLGGAQGQASDIEITAREIQKLKKELYEIISHHTKKDYETKLLVDFPENIKFTITRENYYKFGASFQVPWVRLNKLKIDLNDQTIVCSWVFPIKP